jgi:RNA polymerase sigma-70 factor (ECF subfamily)
MEEESAKRLIQEWYFQHSDEIYRFILMLIHDHEQAKDLMHDTFLKSYYSLDHYQGRTSVKNWLYRIARNLAIDYKRKTRPVIFWLGEWNIYSTKPEHCPQTFSELGDQETQLYLALKKLKHSYQEVIILRKIKDLSIQETSEVLGWSEGKVKTTLFRAQKALKEQLLKEGYIHEGV